MKKPCVVCGKAFNPYRSTSITCGAECQAVYRNRYEAARRDVRATERRQRRATDPEWAERCREATRKSRAKRRSNAEIVAKERERRLQRYAADAKYRAAILKRQHERYQPRPITAATCQVCGASFAKAGNANVRTCGPECRRELKRETQRRYVVSHPGRRAESSEKYRTNNREKCLDATMRHRSENLERYRMHAREAARAKRAASRLGIPSLLYTAMKIASQQQESDNAPSLHAD